MRAFFKFKRRVGIITNCLRITPLLCKINLILFHWKERKKMCHWGKDDPEKKYLLIRPMSKTQGLLSTYFYVMNNVKWAYENNYIPYVDFETDNCQYYTGRIIQGTRNAWEYYFMQPSNLTKKEILTKKNVLLSGWTTRKKYKVQQISGTVDELGSDRIISLVNNNIGIRDYIHNMADEKFNELFSGRVLGVFMRGTDYVRIKPKGHAVQPSLEQVVSKIDEYLKQYTINKIYVVTEDYEYFSALQEKYGEMVFSADDYFIKNYSGSDYVEAAFDNDPYERGLNYIIRILLLNKCNYLISGITNGSLVSCCWRKNDFDDEFWFDLGNY